LVTTYSKRRKLDQLKAELGPYFPGTKFAEISTAAGIAEALRAKIAPTLRVQGSGATSDFEIKQFMSAIPSLAQYPEGRELLATYTQRFADRAAAAADIKAKMIEDGTYSLKAFQNQLKTAGYVDSQTLASWAKYDDAYVKLQANPNDINAKELYNKRPEDYIVPDQRMDKDVKFAKDFFSQYLKPRFDTSQSISEFQNYIDVTKNTQNPFQTQDRMDALKLAAQTSVTQWYANLQKLGDSKFNALMPGIVSLYSLNASPGSKPLIPSFPK